MDGQKFCLKWDGFHGNVTSVFDNLRQNDELVDISLCCEGQRVRAHKMMLSACSPYFRDLLKETPCQQMVIFLKDTSATDLQAIVEFMYKGSVNVAQSQLASFIKTAEMLQIRGLSGDDEKAQPPESPSPSPVRQRAARLPTSPAPEPPPPAKRRRVSSLPATGSEAPPPQVIDCTLSPDPEPSPADQSPSTPGGGISQHSLPSPAPSPSRVASSEPTRPFQRVASSLPDTKALPPSTSAYLSSNEAYYGDVADPADVKVEKVEAVSGDEDSASLGATLDHVAEYEGGGAYGGYPSLEMEAVEQQDYDVQMGTGGPQHQGVDDGTQKGMHPCSVCGRLFSNRQSLGHHRKVHDGVTVCSICGKASARVSDLRRHLRLVHRLGEDQIWSLVPTRTAAPPRPVTAEKVRADGIGTAESLFGNQLAVTDCRL